MADYQDKHPLSRNIQYACLYKIQFIIVRTDFLKNKEKGSSKNEEPKLVFWMSLLMLVNERIYPIQPIQIRLSAIRSFITLSRLEAIFFEWMILPSILSEVIF